MLLQTELSHSQEERNSHEGSEGEAKAIGHIFFQSNFQKMFSVFHGIIDPGESLMYWLPLPEPYSVY